MPGGRPTKYQPVFSKQAHKLCLLGATDKELSDFFEVSLRTLNDWKRQKPEFLHSLKRGKELADANVAKKLYERATGYSHTDVDIKVIKDQIVETPLVKHYPPDTIAAIFWLKNRKKEYWRDKSAIELDGMTEAQMNEIFEKLIKHNENGSK